MSQTAELPVNSKPYQNVDEFTLSEYSDSLYDGYIDELGNTNKRNGLTIFKNIGSNATIQGLNWWQNKSILIVVSDGNIYKITTNTGTLTNITGDKLATTGRVSFAHNGSTMVLANGGRMITTDGTANTAYIADADAPTSVSHVAFLDQWLLANSDGTGKFYYADFTAAPTTWLSTSVFTAEAHPDNLLALAVNKRIIYLFGSESVEFWYSDGTTPFSRNQGTTTARGIISKNAFVFANEVCYYIDDRLRLVRLAGTEPQIISTPFDKTIQAFSTVSDITMDYVSDGGRHFVLINFPTEDRTLIYDILSESWYEWSYYDTGTQTRKRFLGGCYAYARDWNFHLFGHITNSQIYKMTSTSYNDDGQEIYFSKVTGNIDHGSPSKLKRSYKLTFKVKTGFGLGAGGNTVPYMLVRWRDDGDSVWKNWRYVSLKTKGNRKFLGRLKGLGSYRTRQYEFKVSCSVPFTLGKCYEEFDVNAF